MGSKRQAGRVDQRKLRSWWGGKQDQGRRKGLLTPRWAGERAGGLWVSPLGASLFLSTQPSPRHSISHHQECWGYLILWQVGLTSDKGAAGRLEVKKTKKCQVLSTWMYQLWLSLAPSTKKYPNSQWLKQRSVYFSQVTEVQRWEVLDWFSERLLIISRALAFALCDSWSQDGYCSSRHQDYAQRKSRVERMTLAFVISVIRKTKVFPDPPPSKFRYLSHWPKLSERAQRAWEVKWT